MSTEDIEDVLAGMDWVAIEKTRAFGLSGHDVVLYSDGSFAVESVNTIHPDADAEGIIGIVRGCGSDAVDADEYLEGWEEPAESEHVAWNEDGYVYRHVSTGEEVADDALIDSFTGREMPARDALELGIEERYGNSYPAEIVGQIIGDIERARQEDGDELA